MARNLGADSAAVLKYFLVNIVYINIYCERRLETWRIPHEVVGCNIWDFVGVSKLIIKVPLTHK